MRGSLGLAAVETKEESTYLGSGSAERGPWRATHESGRSRAGLGWRDHRRGRVVLDARTLAALAS
jgi:hypothetical protein